MKFLERLSDTLAGTDVARIGLGTNRLTSTPENHVFLREAVEAGIGVIDTAHVYAGGDSERAIGEALSPAPDGLVVATKGGYSGSGSPDALRAQIEQSHRCGRRADDRRKPRPDARLYQSRAAALEAVGLRE